VEEAARQGRVETGPRASGWREGALARPWSDRSLSAILDAAVELAGLFESVYLAYCRDAARSPEDSTVEAER